MTVSILITHFNRSRPLKLLIDSLREIDFKFPYEIVVSDDCSDQNHFNFIKSLNHDQFITTEINKGLGHNLNKGIRACKGKYILYIQEDHIASKGLAEITEEALGVLEDGSLDMVRLWRNYEFPKMLKVTSNIYRIPNFSIKNFKVNCFRYSDRPFIVPRDFFDRFGYYMELRNGYYGESEYTIRMLKLKAKIGMSDRNYFRLNNSTSSVLRTKPVKKRTKTKFQKKVFQYLRAFRLHLEWLIYDPKKRGLFTYKQ